MNLVIGYGNTTRGDDGLGAEVARRLADKKLPGVEVWILQQLHPELAEEMLAYDRVILVDASESGPPILFRHVAPLSEAEVVSSHHMAPELLAGLAEKLYGKSLELYICTLRGEKFGLDTGLSPQAERRAAESLPLLEEFLTKKGKSHARRKLHPTNR
jgi:hydrogenase maturation protease